MPRTLSAAEYKELGKRYYAKKEYQAACDAFTEVRDDVTASSYLRILISIPRESLLPTISTLSSTTIEPLPGRSLKSLKMLLSMAEI